MSAAAFAASSPSAERSTPGITLTAALAGQDALPPPAALAYGDPRRRAYWEAELLNALTIVDRNWAEPATMIGSWAGAMGHTQWMPEVWLHMGVDYDKDGKINPFGKPDDALAGTAGAGLSPAHQAAHQATGRQGLFCPPAGAGRIGPLGV